MVKLMWMVMSIHFMSMHFIRGIHRLSNEVTMAKRGRKPLDLRNVGINEKLIKRNYYIEEAYVKALTVLSALTSKELSLLVNEAIYELIHKYQSKTEINLLEIRMIQNEEQEDLSSDIQIVHDKGF